MEYRKGKDNKAANALSRITEEEEIEEQALMALSTPTPSWIGNAKEEYSSNSELQKLRKQFDERELYLTLYIDHDGLIFHKGRSYIAADSTQR